jgi:FMN reductase
VTARHLVVVTAGLTEPSSTRLLADRLAEATRRALAERHVDAEVEVVELRPLAHAVTDHLLTGFATGRLRDALDTVAAADAVVAVTPTFSASYSGLFKSFVDVLGEGALDGTPVLLAATGGTARHSLMLENAMRPLFSYLRAVVVPTAVYAATEDWASAYQAALGARIDRAAGELADLVAARPPAAAPADPMDDFVPLDTLLAGGDR